MDRILTRCFFAKYAMICLHSVVFCRDWFSEQHLATMNVNMLPAETACG